MLEHHRKVIRQVLSPAESVGTRSHAAQSPDVERFGIDHTLCIVRLGTCRCRDRPVPVETERWSEQILVAAGQCWPAEPALVLGHETTAHPAAKIRRGRAVLEDWQFIIVVARDAVGHVVGGEDAAVEEERQFASPIAGEHIAEELVVASHKPSGIVRLGTGIHDDMRARPELTPTFRRPDAGR